MKSPAVTLISPGIIKWTDVDFGLPHLVAIGGYLQHHLGVRVELLDLSYEGVDHHGLVEKLEALGPHLMIGLSCYSSFDYMRVMSLARFLRAKFPGVPLVAGGYHASAMPQDMVFDGSPFSAVIVGEGELPMRKLTERLLGGEKIESEILGPDNIDDINELPPYRWELLHRYWPRAGQLGRKLQIYLSRGCPYHCAFCMERAKTEYKWRAFSEERALDELSRLAKFTKLSGWVVNIADPLFGFKRKWRRTVLEGIIERKLLPKQYWTLTRSDDLDDEDVKLLARARFSIGIGAESGSPRMLEIMDKTRTPERYLEALELVARLSRVYKLNWAANVIVGHPGETIESMRETHTFFKKLYSSAAETCGWLSLDPYRLYPGALIHEQMAVYGEKYGTRFYHPEWWKSWYDGPFLAEHTDPSSTLNYAGRVREMYRLYGPLLEDIQRRFRGQGSSVDRVFERSLSEQRAMMSPKMEATLLERAARAEKLASKPAPGLKIIGQSSPAPAIQVPVGLLMRDEGARKREQRVRGLLDGGVLRTDRLVEALLAVEAPVDGEVPIKTLVLALEALEPGPGDRVLLLGGGAYAEALLAELARPGMGSVEVPREKDLTAPRKLRGQFDRVLQLGAVPVRPPWLADLLYSGGRWVGFIGPRFRAQDLSLISLDGDKLAERVIARAQVPIMRGVHGWIAA
jgi:radical SAM superfamily enzyme YgiQ (UPF0313 family)/protein-L-isoaspartate O-methyltransferase